MDQAVDNPASNILGPGIADADLIEAVRRSGYPLQTVVGEQLQADFRVQDEWGFIDRDTGEARALDLAASKWLWGPDQPRIRPELNLLIECKQSELPYVFFLRGKGPILRSPLVVGGRGTEVTLTTDDDRSSYRLDVLSALGVDGHDFASTPRHAVTFSKAVRKGKGLDLSGSDAYTSLFLPVLKAMLFFEKTHAGPPKWYSDLHLVVGVGVLDAPIVGVSVANQQPTFELVPWVRALRHESYETTSPFERHRLFAIDIVHSAFLDRYVSEHLIPFARVFGERVIAKQALLLAEKGYARGLGRGARGDALYETLEERPPGDRVRRLWRPLRN
ncbi:MAG: hypothetical protein M3321_08110 [Actinomycetota bacterium]|nr:hypothetical protein [Actinomycetota bacterium]